MNHELPNIYCFISDLDKEYIKKLDNKIKYKYKNLNLIQKSKNFSCPLQPTFNSHTHCTITPKTTQEMPMGIADTGASKTMVTSNTTLKNVTTGKTMTIIMPNNATTTSNKQGHLPINMPKAATHANIVPTFTKKLVSIGQIVDAGYKALFEPSTVKIINDKTEKV